MKNIFIGTVKGVDDQKNLVKVFVEGEQQKGYASTSPWIEATMLYPFAGARKVLYGLHENEQVLCVSVKGMHYVVGAYYKTSQEYQEFSEFKDDFVLHLPHNYILDVKENIYLQAIQDVHLEGQTMTLRVRHE